MPTTEEMINKMYDSQLASQKEQLDSDYVDADARLTEQKEKNQKAADANIHHANVAAKKAAVSDAEYYAASGLTSGAKAQARLARDNQLQSDLTAIRTAQQEADAQVERERSLLARDYTAAIRQAQAQNDLQKAQALYEQAQKDDAALLAKQEAAANLMAGVGDFSAYGSLYGLTGEQMQKLSSAYAQTQSANALAVENAEFEKKWKVATDMAEYGDDTYLKELLKELGMTPPDEPGGGYPPKATETENTRSFAASILTRHEFGRRGSKATVNGKTVTNYNDYVKATLEKWMTEGKLTDAETAWLINHYGI